MTSPTLHTERLVLEPYTPEDEDAFVALFQDDEVVRWVGDGRQTEADDRAMFQRIFQVYAEDRFDVWAVRRAGADRAVIGHAEIKRTDTVDGHELVYVLAKSTWGAGLGTELARAIVGYGFGTLGLDAVHATVAAENAASLRVLERLGFEHVRDVTEEDGGVVAVLTVRRG